MHKLRKIPWQQLLKIIGVIGLIVSSNLFSTNTK